MMIIQQFLVCMVALCAVLIRRGLTLGFGVELPVDHHELWIQFKLEYNKTYETGVEESLRRIVFEDNLKFIEEFNSRGNSSFKLGINKFTDWTSQEYGKLNNYAINNTSSYSSRESEQSRKLLEQAIPEMSRQPNYTLPDHFDWRDTDNVVTPVKDQGKCNAPWAFSITGVLEGNQRRQGMLKLVALSEQSMIDCLAKYKYGCHGGDIQTALLWIRDEGGIESERDYPYRNKDREFNCGFKRSKVVFSIQSVVILAQGDELQLATAVALHSPVSVGIDASSREFMLYKSGVFDLSTCSRLVSHAVLVVGYGHDAQGGDFWIVKNSWGAKWGDQGYIRMSRNKHSQCGIADHPILPVFF